MGELPELLRGNMAAMDYGVFGILAMSPKYFIPLL
jgi:hypothetical protein